MEVMVAVSIFAIVMTVGIGSLLTINDGYRKSQTQREGIDSLTYVLESMSRRIRTAADWSPTNAYGSTGTQFAFNDQDCIAVSYGLVQGQNGNGQIQMNIQNGTGSTNQTLADGPYDITPENVSITDMTFTSFRAANVQPYVQINIKGTVANGKTVSDFAFQTSVSKRSADGSTPVCQ